ncbi:ubiquinol-cytochrome c reductase iron-sulfur subunit [Desulfitobacterium sp. AusDCA]
MLPDDRLLYTRRQILHLGRKALMMIGVCSIYPVSLFLTGKEKHLAEARIEIKEMLLNNKWQRLGQTRFWLCQGDDGVEAMWASCTHLGCEVSFDLQQDQWICPCHGSRYNREGQPIQGPAVTSLARAIVKEKDGYYTLTQPVG